MQFLIADSIYLCLLFFVAIFIFDLVFGRLEVHLVATFYCDFLLLLLGGLGVVQFPSILIEPLKESEIFLHVHFG